MPWLAILWGALAGAAALFVWGALCWVALRHHFGDWQALGEEGPLEAALAKAAAAPGLYALPHWDRFQGGAADPAFQARFARGPNAHLFVIRDVSQAPGTFLKGLLLNFATAALLAVLLYGGFLAVHGLVSTVVLFSALGLLAHGANPAQRSIWMGYPWRPVFTGLFDGVVGFALLGLVLHLLR